MKQHTEVIDGKEVVVKVYKTRMPRTKAITANCGLAPGLTKAQILRRYKAKKEREELQAQRRAKNKAKRDKKREEEPK